MRAGVAVLLLTLLVPGAVAADIDRDDRKRRLDLEARSFAKAVERMVTSCTKCAGNGRLRRERQTWTCPRCKGTGNQVVRTWHEKVHWTMRSHAYRAGAGSRKQVLLSHLDEMRRNARPLRAGAFDHVELIDDTHGVSWHRDEERGWTQFRWIHEAEHGWAWFHPKHDGAWPESDADFGVPGAKAADFIEQQYDASTNRTTVATMPLALGSGLRLRASFDHAGKACTSPPPTVRVAITIESESPRFVHAHALTFFADGHRIDIRSPRHESKAASKGRTQETVAGALARVLLIRLAGAERVEGLVGATGSFSLTSAQRRILATLGTLADACRPK